MYSMTLLQSSCMCPLKLCNKIIPVHSHTMYSSLTLVMMIIDELFRHIYFSVMVDSKHVSLFCMQHFSLF